MINGKLSPRRVSRSLAVQGLYFFQANPRLVGEIEDFLHDLDPELYSRSNYSLLHSLLEMATSNFTMLLSSYHPFLERTIDEIEYVEKAILVLAATELHHSPEVPAPVIINEAIELAKLYGGEDSYKFINGLVDKLAFNTRYDEMTHFKQRKISQR
jgi:N utilization substance protein B